MSLSYGICILSQILSPYDHFLDLHMYDFVEVFHEHLGEFGAQVTLHLIVSIIIEKGVFVTNFTQKQARRWIICVENQTNIVQHIKERMQFSFTWNMFGVLKIGRPSLNLILVPTCVDLFEVPSIFDSIVLLKKVALASDS